MKNDGTHYEPESLRVMIACPDRHLGSMKQPTASSKGRCFETSHKILVFEGKAIELRKQGTGKQKMKVDVVMEEEELSRSNSLIFLHNSSRGHT